MLASIQVPAPALKSGLLPRNSSGQDVDRRPSTRRVGHNHATPAMTSCGATPNVVPPSGCPVTSGVLHDTYTAWRITFNRDQGTDVLGCRLITSWPLWMRGRRVASAVGICQADAARYDGRKCSGWMGRRTGRRRPASCIHGCRATRFRCDYVTRVVHVSGHTGFGGSRPSAMEANGSAKCSSQTVSSSPPTVRNVPRRAVFRQVGTTFPSSSANYKDQKPKMQCKGY